MCEPPDAVHAEEPEDVLHAESGLDIGVRHRGHARGEEKVGLRSGRRPVVFARKRAPHALADQHLAPFQLFDQRQAAQQHAVEVVLPEPRHPCVGGELVEIHAREGVGIVEIGAVALVEFEQLVGDLAEDAPALHRDVRIPHGRQFRTVADAAFEAVVFVAAVQRVGNPRRESERQDRVDRTHRLLVEGHAVDRFVFREPQADVHRGVGNRVDGHTVGSQHRHVTVGEGAVRARARQRT